ncbi:MAG TPA: 16S rRNA (cytosine(1402)-N(4))-methyltransferase RsmH [Pyrinomonadaceae bacterium]|nr:16S rRNA (cytosine(1402)-N(4))-methyltransferase RsmH [Pyrinomonadaceae bacterium]
MHRDAGSFTHQSVLLDETLALINASNGGEFVDATLGLGGHTEAILAANDANTVLGIDQDTEALQRAGERLAKFGKRFESVHSNFSNVAEVANGRRFDGIIADLGVSSMQLDDETRGFSFREDAPLDMRMDVSTGRTAAELLDEEDEETIANLIYKYGEERNSRRIAKWIVEKQGTDDAITTTKQLADLVERASRGGPKEKIHPATRTFQALRIAVNDEIDIIEPFLRNSINALKTDGVLAVITFHSLEDRIVKQAFRRFSGKCECPPRQPVCTCGAEKLVEILTRKPIVPKEAELAENPRSRSAKLRACRKLAQ